MSDATGGENRIFLRKASGLIRTASGLDTFIYNLGLVSVGLGVASIMLYGPAFYPGGDLIWACLLAAVMMSCIAFGFLLPGRPCCRDRAAFTCLPRASCRRASR